MTPSQHVKNIMAMQTDLRVLALQWDGRGFSSQEILAALIKNLAESYCGFQGLPFGVANTIADVIMNDLANHHQGN